MYPSYHCDARRAPPGSPTLWLRGDHHGASAWRSQVKIAGSNIDFVAGGAYPAATDTVDGKICPKFDGATEYIKETGANLGNLIVTGAYTGGAVLRLNTLTGSTGAAGFDQRALITDSNGSGGGGNFYPVIFNSTGISGGHFSGSDKKITSIAVIAGVTYVVLFWFDGTTFHLTVNGTTNTIAAGNVSVAGGLPVRIGANYAASPVFAPITLCGFALYASDIGSSSRTDLDRYFRDRFPSAT